MEKPWYPCTHNDKVVTLLDHMNHIADKHRSGTFFTNVAFSFSPREVTSNSFTLTISLLNQTLRS